MRRLRTAELIAASNAFWFGVWILIPAWSISYRVRILYAPEWLWGAIPIAISALLMLSIWQDIQLGRIIALLLAMIFFVGLVIVFLLTDRNIGAIPLYLHAALLYALLALLEASELRVVK